MKKQLLKSLVLLVVSLFCVQAQAQTVGLKAQYMIYGGVYDSYTRSDAIGTKIYLMSTDSTVIEDDVLRKNSGAANRMTAWGFFIPKESKSYIVHFTKEGYEDQYLNIPPQKFGREAAIFIKDVFLKRKPKERKLGEAVVKATRVKIYAKGDTLVYNADAFQMAEGSMLDALIKQLPGVELKDDGRILVNGKYVDNLLLNGEDFFKKDRSVMLDNLPSYTVNNIKVYDKQGDLSRLAGKDMGDKELVMDVRLKKEYSIGWLANAEGAAGTENRYIGRAFALRFTPQSRISFFANLNNLNETRKPGQDGEWTPDQLSGGLTATKTAGADYLVNDRLKRFTLNGEAKLTHTDLENQTAVSSENFLPQGNTWARSENLQRNKNTSFTTNHSLKFMWKKADLRINPYFYYNKWNNYGNHASATFSEDPGLYATQGIMDSIRTPNAGSMLRRIAVNRSINLSKIDGHNVSTGGSFRTNIKAYANDIWALYGGMNYYSSEEDNFSHYLVDHPSDASAQTDYRNRWTKDDPNQNFNYNAGTSYFYWLPINMMIKANFDFGQSIVKNENALYRLDKLEGWGATSDHPLGSLPSETEQLLSTIDTWNSYDSKQTDTWEKTGLFMQWDIQNLDKGQTLRMELSLPMTFTHNHLDYRRATVDNVFTRNTAFFEPSLKVERKWKNFERTFKFQYDVNASAPAMTNLIELENTRDPLRIYNGNANLKNTFRHTVKLNYSDYKSAKQKFFSAYATYYIRKDAVASGYRYNRSTGVYTYTPDNVNGNYVVNGGVNYSTPLDKAKRLTLNTYTFAQFYHNVDLISVEEADVPARSAVQTLWVTETVRLDYRIGKAKIGAKIGGSWHNATSHRDGFKTINVGDFNYGPTAQISLPLNVQLNTDITMFSRRGYADDAANTNDMVWNASLSKRVMKGKLTFKLEGFDLLGQLSNTTQTINSQGRYETYRNVIPRYVMLHAIYRLNVTPKKRQGE
ncbi:MAG: outer membrane beta-barrel protein [Bacteroidaceae bacterium]